MTSETGGILVVFGLDAYGRRRAARFREPDEPRARAAAEALGFRSVRVVGRLANEAAERLREGCLYRTGSGLAPGVSQSTYAWLAEIAETSAQSPELGAEPGETVGRASITGDVEAGPIDEQSVRKQKGEPK